MRFWIQSLRVAVVGACVTALAAAPGRGPSNVTIEEKGFEVGERLPDLEVRVFADDQPEGLSGAVGGGLPMVIVTASFTSPRSRAMMPSLIALEKKYHQYVRFVVLYGIETHPAGDPSPYSGKIEATPENERDSILLRQPPTIDKRITLARDFRDRFSIDFPVLVDGMGNWGWKIAGGGENAALLVDSERVILAKQAAFDPAGLEPAIEKAVAEVKSRPVWPASGAYWRDSDRAMHVTLQRRKVLGEPAVFSSFDWLLQNPEKIAALPTLLETYPGMVTLVLPYQGKGDVGGETILQSAARMNNAAAVKALLDAGADPDARTPWREPALFIATRRGDAEPVKLMLEKSKSPEIRLAAMELAFLHAPDSVSDLFLAAGVKGNLFTQVARGDGAALKAALAKDPLLPLQTDDAGCTLLDYAAARGQTAMVKQIAGAMPGVGRIVEDDFAVTAAIEHDHADTLAALLEAGCDPNARAGSFNDRALHAAVGRSQPHMVELLLKAGAKVSTRNNLGMTPLHDAASRGDVESMRVLIAGGADVNARSGNVMLPSMGPGDAAAKEETPLHKAAESGSAEAVTFLLEHHANAAAEDVDGKTAVDHAGNEAVRKVLAKAGAGKGSGKSRRPSADPREIRIIEF